MSDSLLGKQVYAGLLVILRDREYYYQSSFDPFSYNKLTPEGEQVILDYIRMMAPHMCQQEKTELENIAKRMTWNELKK